MEESKSVELIAELVADKVCHKLLFISGVCILVTGLSIITFATIIPSFTFEVYKKQNLKT